MAKINEKLFRDLVLGIFLGASLFSCRKTDIPQQTKAVTDMETRFFADHRSGDVDEKAIVDFVRRANDKNSLLAKTVERIGYPRWDKTMKTQKNLASQSISKAMGTSGPSAAGNTGYYDIYYVPFVRDSQNYVNAAMVIKASAKDTSISYLCDWQYKRMANSSNRINDKAEYMAVFFMVLDNKVFGHTRFKITDQSLFAANNNRPTEVTLGLSKSEVDDKPSYMYYAQTCLDVTVWYVPNTCTYNGGVCYGPGGSCDHCGIPQCPALSSVTFSYCWGEWIYTDGGGGGGGTGGSGDTGGGGGGGGPVPPDPCGGDNNPVVPANVGNHASGNVKSFSEPCNPNPGWTPSGYDRPIDPSSEIYSNDLGRMITYGEITQAFENNPGMIDAVEQELDFSEHGYLLLPGDMAADVAVEYFTLKLLHPDWSKVRLISTAYWNVLRETVHFYLDVAGIVPVIGDAVDLVNGAIYFVEGDQLNAAISAGAAIPVWGWTATAGKWVKNATKTLSRPLTDAAGKLAFRAVKTSKGVFRFIKVAAETFSHSAVKALKAVQPADQSLTNLSRQLVDEAGHRVAPTLQSLRTKIDDIVLNGDALGTKTESICDDIFQTDGFVKHEAKLPGNNGFDGVYIKQDAAGNVEEIIINEAKQIGNVGNIKLNPENFTTGLKPQMSDEWIEGIIRKMRQQGGNLAALSDVLSLNKNKIVKTVTGVDKSTQEIVILKLAKY
ncbi:hypothetical protein [Sediminibacterium soli]|uniref:hypothetical protein n=1 Tax=Sediminibacterium soli TaxID=2698829 RepID=UPI00137A4D62|nr:hypothetical protein [Sediminibacterium soli]NCI45619.1 hypothetical protein [Sediminibacterium soli]